MGYPDAVAPPVQLLYETDQQQPHPLPPDTSLRQVYDDAGHELLLLGEPGAGKSTLLLELASDLVETAERDHSQFLPVIVPLSSWASKRQPLEQWLAEQIAQVYAVSQPLSRRWVQEERLLPLLDGLDEMDEEARMACIGAINTYHHQHLHPLVVASRKADYEVVALRERLSLYSAVVIQPLTIKQVDDYLEQIGEPVTVLHGMLAVSPLLQEVVTTPLMLSILILTYQGKAVGDLPVSTSLSEQQREIFMRYVERMLARKGKLLHYSSQELVSWLRRLAQQMRVRNQVIFYLEHLQPDWLPAKRFRPLYETLAGKGMNFFIGFIISLAINTFFFGGELIAYNALFGLSGGLIGWLFYRERNERFSITSTILTLKQQWKSLMRESMKMGLSAGVLTGLIFSLWPNEGSNEGWVTGASMFSYFFLLTFTIRAGKFPENVSSSRSAQPVFLRLFPELRREHIKNGFFTGVPIGLCMVVSMGGGVGISSAVIYTLVGIVLSLLLLGKDGSITLNDKVTFSGRNLLQRSHLLSTLSLFFLVFLLYIYDRSFLGGLKDVLIHGLSGAWSVCILYWGPNIFIPRFPR